ncbi:MAG: hypothetical protein U9N19_06585, partial [Thermodesulfobacteriota bacterium]|nr:hypothetical protein [Thermodesulfobacteriota bacterium]
ISSTGFYFNDNVEIEIEKTGEGLKITRFETRILDKQGKRLKGLDDLAMLLVDIDYDGEIFDMDRTVFAKDISENGEIKLAGLTESVAVIAVDKERTINNLNKLMSFLPSSSLLVDHITRYARSSRLEYNKKSY